MEVLSLASPAIRRLCWPRWMDGWTDERTDRCLGCYLGEEPWVTLTLLFSRQRLPGVPDQWQLGRPCELLGVPGDSQ